MLKNLKATSSNFSIILLKGPIEGTIWEKNVPICPARLKNNVIWFNVIKIYHHHRKGQYLFWCTLAQCPLALLFITSQANIGITFGGNTSTPSPPPSSDNNRPLRNIIGLQLVHGGPKRGPKITRSWGISFFRAGPDARSIFCSYGRICVQATESPAAGISPCSRTVAFLAWGLELVVKGRKKLISSLLTSILCPPPQRRQDRLSPRCKHACLESPDCLS